MMDNRVFNVNGRGTDMLTKTLELAFIQEGWANRPSTAKAWKVTPRHGLILLWHIPENDKDVLKLPAPMTAKEIVPMIVSWLSSDAAKLVELTGWDADADHDGSNESGWRVFCEDWGHVAGLSCAICAVKPACMWLGK